ncbi:hypothetical protein TNCV_4081211 [Trichonephila clavipes]|nr:hypothetical protein TNCV_4081211 [Trichonephila clavipes]
MIDVPGSGGEGCPESEGGQVDQSDRWAINQLFHGYDTSYAAVGPQALDYVLTNNMGREMENLAQKILTGAVLSIMMTAPIGAALIAILGPLLLSQDKKTNSKEMNSLEAKDDKDKSISDLVV